jgi:tetratricopeptide (TPR) repeat protein
MEKNLGKLEEGLDDLSNKNKFSYANILLELKQYDESIAIYKMLNEKTPKWSCPWRHRGEAYWKKKDYDNALMCSKKAIETRETHYDAYVQLAGIENEMGRCKDALATIEKGLTYYGKDIEDPEQEVSSVDVHFLYLDILKKNDKMEKFEKILGILKEKAPEDERLKKYIE